MYLANKTLLWHNWRTRSSAEHRDIQRQQILGRSHESHGRHFPRGCVRVRVRVNPRRRREIKAFPLCSFVWKTMLKIGGQKSRARDVGGRRKSVRGNGEEPGATVLPKAKSQLRYLGSARPPFSPAISRILVDFGRLPGTVTARNCNVGKRRLRRRPGRLAAAGF